MYINPATKLLAGSAAVLAMLAPAGLADARTRPQVDLFGSGTYTMTEFERFAAGDGTATGKPYAGRVTFMLGTDDGSLPGPGECEGGGANFALTGSKRQELWGVSIGDVCGQYVDQTNVVTHVFTGQYSIAESRPRLRDTEGWIEIRLSGADQMSITLFDS
jgi:hypothetical protein